VKWKRIDDELLIDERRKISHGGKSSEVVDCFLGKGINYSDSVAPRGDLNLSPMRVLRML
jgi:hypothetical protein